MAASKPWEAGFVADGMTQAAPIAPREHKPWDWGFVQGEEEQSPSNIPEPSGRTTPEPEAKTPFDMDVYINKLVGVESSGNPNARNPASTATGLHQFTEATWADWTKRLGLNYTQEDRTDPVKSRRVVEGFTKFNKDRIQNLTGRTPSNVEVYMTHLLGSTGGLRMISAPSSAPAHEHATRGQVSANRSLFYTRGGKARTVSEFMNQFERKFRG